MRVYLEIETIRKSSLFGRYASAYHDSECNTCGSSRCDCFDVKVEQDSSIRGWEYIINTQHPNYYSIIKELRRKNRVNASCGLHINIKIDSRMTKYRRDKIKGRAGVLFFLFNPIFLYLNSGYKNINNRALYNNGYGCNTSYTVLDTVTNRELIELTREYGLVNKTSMGRVCVENRLFDSTLNCQKIEDIISINKTMLSIAASFQVSDSAIYELLKKYYSFNKRIIKNNNRSILNELNEYNLYKILELIKDIIKIIKLEKHKLILKKLQYKAFNQLKKQVIKNLKKAVL